MGYRNDAIGDFVVLSLLFYMFGRHIDCYFS